MARTAKICVTVCLISLICLFGAHAEDLNEVMDNFYNDLADIIERNLDNPDTCVAAVDRYYQQNEAAVQKIRSLMKKAMEEAKSRMGEYGGSDAPVVYTDEEIARIEQSAKQRGMQMPQPPVEDGSSRYSDAIEKLTTKSPRHAM